MNSKTKYKIWKLKRKVFYPCKKTLKSVVCTEYFLTSITICNVGVSLILYVNSWMRGRLTEGNGNCSRGQGWYWMFRDLLGSSNSQL